MKTNYTYKAYHKTREETNLQKWIISTELRFLASYFPGTTVRLTGKFYGSVNGVEVSDIILHVIAISTDGRVYAVMRNPPLALAHLLKILTPLIDAVGWIYGLRKAKGVPNGFGVVGTKIKRNVVVTFDSGMFSLKILVRLPERDRFKLYSSETEGLIIIMNCDTSLY